jgi:hypothetical protein
MAVYVARVVHRYRFESVTVICREESTCSDTPGPASLIKKNYVIYAGLSYRVGLWYIFCVYGGPPRADICASQPVTIPRSHHLVCCCHAGTLLRRRGSPSDLSVASSLLSDALRYEPDNPMGWYNLGLVRKAQGQVDDAEEALFSALNLAAAAPVIGYSQCQYLVITGKDGACSPACL